ncbi:MAG: BTAD domain-containing putative transcriptional regulator [Anaerolineae bacterium]
MANHQAHIESSYRALKSLKEPIILLHPHSRYRSLLLARLMNETSTPCFYYALDPDDINVQTLVESMTRTMSSQFPFFGRHLNLQPEAVFKNFGAHEELVMETFRRELSDLCSEHFYLLLDEYDRSDNASDIHRFIELLAEYLPPNCQLILNGRTLPRLPWIALVAKRKAAILMDDQCVENNFYEKPNRTPPYVIQAKTLGPGHVYVNDEIIEDWEGHLPRLLLFFALDRPIVTRSEICYAFWPTLDTDQAVNVFHVTKRRLHKAIGHDILVHADVHYQINPDIPIYYDAFEFVEALTEGRNPNTERPIEAWKRAIELYGGPFLHGHDEKWVQERRSAYRVGYIEALMEMADYWIGRERFEMAIRQYELAINAAFDDPLPHMRLIDLYARLGRRSEAVAHYQHVSETFRSDGRQIPASLQMLYGQLTT